MQKTRFATVGLGAVGTALTKALSEAGYQPVFLVGRGRVKDQELAMRLGCDSRREIPLSLENIDFILVTIQTAKLSVYATELVKRQLPWHKLVFIHTAGPLGVAPFAPFAQRGAGVAAMHPYQTFPKRQRSVTLDGITYGITGDWRGTSLARRLARDLGGHPVMVKEEDRVLYHLSAVMACAFTAASLEMAESILKTIGVEQRPRERATRVIAEETIRNVRELGTRAAMTGPAARGDVAGVERHVRELKQRLPERAELYATMSEYILSMRPERDHSKSRKRSK